MIMDQCCITLLENYLHTALTMSHHSVALTDKLAGIMAITAYSGSEGPLLEDLHIYDK